MNSQATAIAVVAADEPAGQRFGLSFLFATLYFVQGVAEPTEGLIAQPVRSLLRSWGQSTAEIATFSALIAIPWAIKPLYALLSDFVPIFGTRRRSYLLITLLMTMFGLLWLYAVPLAAGSELTLLTLLLIPTIGVAFSDVVLDGLMVEKGKPLGLTGRFQSIQWGAMYTATIIVGWLGGYLSEGGHQREALLICAVTAAFSWIVVLVFAQEPKQTMRERPKVSARQTVAISLRSPALLSAGAFVFLWSFNPFSTSVLYVHMREQLHLSEQFYGTSVTLLSVGSVAASICYGFFCRRFSIPRLVHLSIVLGVLSTLAYWFMYDQMSAAIISIFVGFTYMLGCLVLFDISARACPLAVAATAFALLMALTNLSFSLSTGLGGMIYDVILASKGPQFAFDALVGVGAAANCLCWLVVPWLLSAPAAIDG